jgi:hypothetical protein
MAKLDKAVRDGKQKGSMAEEFELTNEAKFQAPSLEQRYWSAPNQPRGQMAICSYGPDGLVRENKRTEGI